MVENGDAFPSMLTDQPELVELHTKMGLNYTQPSSPPLITTNYVQKHQQYLAA